MGAEGVVAPTVMNRAATLQLIAMATQALHLVVAQHRLQTHRSLHGREVHPVAGAGHHWLSPGGVSLVRQLRGPHFNTWPWCRRRSSMALTAAVSPNILPQSSTTRFDVNSVLARS